jgi:hypothetical protein
MTTENDPPRWRSVGHELPPELVRALAATPDEEATAEDLRAVAAEVRRLSGSSAPRFPRRHAAATRQTRRLGAAALVLTFALGAGAGILVSGATYFVLRSAQAPAPRLPAPVMEPRTKRDEPPSARVSGGAPGKELVAPPPTSVAPRQQRPRSPVADEPDVAPALERATDTPSSPAANQDELVLLARAQALLAKDANATLALAAEHERTFSGGVLVQEREVMAIDALLRLGRKADAIARAERFHRQFPTSAHRRRVDVLLEVREESEMNQK